MDQDRGVRYGALVNLAAWIGSGQSVDLTCGLKNGSEVDEGERM